jgi:hypothetical protein
MRGNRTLVLVLGLLLLPFVVAATLYAVGWHPDSAGNHGELLSPAAPPAAPGRRHRCASGERYQPPLAAGGCRRRPL